MFASVKMSVPAIKQCQRLSCGSQLRHQKKPLAHKNVLNILPVTKNYVLPAGATVVIGTYKVHRDEKHYKNPDVFNPDNFLPENMANRHYYSYIPFSAGPRSCVGEYGDML